MRLNNLLQPTSFLQVFFLLILVYLLVINGGNTVRVTNSMFSGVRGLAQDFQGRSRRL